MHISCILAGTLLARLGRPEVSNCIAGLEQYSYAYEEAGDQANEMSRLFQRVRYGDLELNHMASVITRVAPVSSPPVQSNAGMMVDTQIHRPNASSHVMSFLNSFLLNCFSYFQNRSAFRDLRHVLETYDLWTIIMDNNNQN
jgi:hypothetical protein